MAEASLYLCTDARTAQGDLAEFLDAAFAGADIIQLRDKSRGPREIEALRSSKMPPPATASSSPSMTAPTSHPHRGRCFPRRSRRLTSDRLRAVLGPDVIPGRSTHSSSRRSPPRQTRDRLFLCRAGLGDPTKPGARVGTALATATAAEAAKPWFAIGGIAVGERMDAVRQAGAKRAVVVRAITSAEDPAAAARELKEELK